MSKAAPCLLKRVRKSTPKAATATSIAASELAVVPLPAISCNSSSGNTALLADIHRELLSLRERVDHMHTPAGSVANASLPISMWSYTSPPLPSISSLPTLPSVSGSLSSVPISSILPHPHHLILPFQLHPW